jgi:glycosyltransferase involved in cell wall biosynthesis
MSKTLKIYWLSNSPMIASGYGNQTELMMNLLREAGHEFIMRGFYGHKGFTFKQPQVTLLPGGHDEWGNDVIRYDWKTYAPDAGVILADAWVYNPDVIRGVPVCMYAPVDHDTIPAQVADVLRNARWLWAMSRHGEREMRRAGLDPFYMPHMVDTETFTPVDRARERAKWAIRPDTFAVMMNAANKGYPPRKSFDKVFKAWALFAEKHPDSLLYIHANPMPFHHGLDLLACMRFYNVPEDSIRFADTHKMRDGWYTHEMINSLYNAADVLLAPSQGEGFGIPVLEAEAAGCPVIVSDFTAQSELCFGGYKVPIDRVDDCIYTLQGAEQAWPRVSEILKALEWAYEQRGNTDLREQARAGALDYDARRVFERYALPTFRMMAQGNADMVQYAAGRGVAA